MKVVILAGGFGTRLSEETESRPKPMVEIGGKPILWHIMKHYAAHGFSDFFVALGYKGDVVKRFFLEYLWLSEDITISLAGGEVIPRDGARESWTINLIDTGIQTNTGGRLGRLSSWLAEEPFMLTYGDGVSNVDPNEILRFHREHGKLATVCAVRPPSRFGAIAFKDNGAVMFTEKPQVGEGWINGGFMVFQPEVLSRIESDETSLEADLLENLSQEDEVMAYLHDDFWQCVDTLRDLRFLRALWDSGKAPWVTWS